jgi:hypothetical protein
VNGVAAGSTTYSTSIGSGSINTNTFGASYQSAGVNSLYFNGSIEALRLIKGQGIYTGTFTPGYLVQTTTAVGSTGTGVVANPITGTCALLAFQSATIVDTSTVPVSLTAVGSPTVDQLGYSTGGAQQADAFAGYKTSTNEFIFSNNVSVIGEVVTPITYGNVRANVYFGNGSQLTGVTKTSDSVNIGTTSIALNRTSAAQSLTGITSIDGNANIASHLMGGTTGSISYQTAANTTGMLAIGTAGQVLTVNSGATAPQWSPLSVDKISNGTSNINISAINGNVNTIVGGSTIASATPSGFSVTGNLAAFTATLSAGGVPITTNSPVINATQSWNNVSTTFTGIALNIIDTASATNSKLIDMQVGGISKFSVDKAGNAIFNSISTVVPIAFPALNGTAPFTTLSNTKVANLNADLLDGYDTSVTNLANTIVVRDANGNIAGGNITGIITTSSQPSITSFGSLTGLVVSNATGVVNFTTTANVTLGSVSNLHITGGTPGQILTTDGAGGLSWGPNSTPTTFYLGTTTVATNRASGTMALTGITSIDGTASALTTPRNINGIPFNGTVDITIPLTGAITATTFSASAMSSFTGMHEVVSQPALGTYNVTNGTVFYHSGVTGAFTATITNLPAVTNSLSRATVVTIIIVQGGTPAYPSGISVNGVGQTIRWPAGLSITGTSNGVDIFSFNILTIGGGVAVVTGNWVAYG